MDHSINIRPYRKEDLPQIEALEARIQPYRPEAEAEVEAMYLRARNAQQSNDPRWMGLPTYEKSTMEDEFDAFWVAVWEQENMTSLVGNTTTPQTPALQLYRKLGFQAAGLSFIDRYELTWLELKL